MSAWLCTPEHIGQLAIKFEEITRGNAYGFAEEIAHRMAITNLASLKHRYPEGREGFGSWRDFLCDETEGQYIEKCIAETRRTKDPHLKFADYFKMLQCFCYQSCEDPDIWDQLRTDTKYFNKAEQAEFNSELVNYYFKDELNQAPWGYERNAA